MKEPNNRKKIINAGKVIAVVAVAVKEKDANAIKKAIDKL